MTENVENADVEVEQTETPAEEMPSAEDVTTFPEDDNPSSLVGDEVE